MKLKLAITVAVLVAVAIPAFGQQDPNDPGLMDTARFEVSNATMVGSDLQFSLDLYVYNDSLTIGVQSWYSWLSPSMQLDSVVIPPAISSSFNSVFTFKTDLATTNADRQFQFGTFRIFESGLVGDASAAKLVASYWFTYTNWTSSDSIVVDTMTVNGNGPLKFINARTTAGEVYVPFWGSKFVYREPTGIDVIGGNGNLPNDYALEQNYPNPFNPTTIIPFSLPHAGEYTLTIFNILGQEVEQFKDVANAPGEYELQWDASNQASGVYFYRLQADSFVQTKKMMLLK